MSLNGRPVSPTPVVTNTRVFGKSCQPRSNGPSVGIAIRYSQGMPLDQGDES